MAEVVLVTGVSRYLGGRFARELSRTPGISHVIGVDVIPPPHDLGGAEFVRADIRNPVIAKVIERSGVDTVVHLNVIATPTSAGGRASMKEINVIGSMQLLAACQKSTTLRRLVVKSTAVVYGSSASDPAQFTEDSVGVVPPRSGWGKDSSEVEGYVRGFSRRRPDVDVAVLRPANIIGPGMRTALTDYLEMPVVPTVLGFDPRLQVVHEEDAVEALRLATTGPVTGIVNVAGAGVLSLHQLIAMTGRLPLPVAAPMMAVVGRLAARTRHVDLSPEQVRFLSFGRVVSTRRMREDLGFSPRFTTRQAVADFVRARGLSGPLSAAHVEQVASLLQQTVGRVLAATRA